jgi:hypothetical protein
MSVARRRFIPALLAIALLMTMFVSSGIAAAAPASS